MKLQDEWKRMQGDDWMALLLVVFTLFAWAWTAWEVGRLGQALKNAESEVQHERR